MQQACEDFRINFVPSRYIYSVFIVIVHFFETISANELMQKRAIFWNERCWITINLPSDTIY